MKLISLNGLNRFWQNGIKPLITRVTKNETDISKINTDLALCQDKLTMLNTALSYNYTGNFGNANLSSTNSTMSITKIGSVCNAEIYMYISTAISTFSTITLTGYSIPDWANNGGNQFGVGIFSTSGPALIRKAGNVIYVYPIGTGPALAVGAWIRGNIIWLAE